MRKTFDSHGEYHKYLWPRVRSIAYNQLLKMFYSEKKAESCVDEIVAHVFEKAREHEMWKNSKKEPIAWLTTCLQNAIRDLYRKSKKKLGQDAVWKTEYVDLSYLGDDELMKRSPVGYMETAKQEFFRQERQAGFEEVIKQLTHFLTEEEQTYLRYSCDGLPDTAICDHMSIKRSRLRKIRTSLEKKAEKLGLRELLFNIATVLSEYFDTLFMLQC